MPREILRRIFKSIILIVSKSKMGKHLGKLEFIKKIEHRFAKFVSPEYVYLNSHKIYLDKEDSLRLSTFGRLYLKSIENQIFNKYVKEGDIVIDVGAFIGDNTLTLARLVGQEGKVYAFEIGEDNFKLLDRNIKENNYKNIIAINKAASDNDNKTKIYIHPFRSTGHKMHNTDVNNKTLKWEEKELDAIKLDSVVNLPVNFIKIDVEGAEPKVIKGAKRIIEESKSLKIILEMSPGIINNFGISAEDYLKRFIKWGFDIYDLDLVSLEDIENRRKVIKTDEDIQEFLRRVDSTTTNLFLIRGDNNV
jgi:FkbM family methyltransferase